jgi:dihydrofolate reductase
MGQVIYAALSSVDGYVVDEEGRFDWAAPDAEVHQLVNDITRPVATHLYGRRMYEVLVAWETMDTSGEPVQIRDYAEIWRAADKVVFSRTLEEPASARTRIEREFDPAAVRRLKAEAGSDISIGGPTLAAQAIRHGLVDEYHFFLAPCVVGGGMRALPDGVRLDLELVEERRFDSGFAYLRYRAAPPGGQP